MAAGKKKMSLKDVKAPDEFQTAMVRVFEFLQLYGGWILAGAAALVITIVAGILLSKRHEAALVEDAVAFQQAFAPVLAAGEPGEGEDEKVLREKSVGAAGKLESFAQEQGEKPLGGLAWVGRGLALAVSGEPKIAVESFRKGLEILGDFSLRPLVLEAVGVAAESAGMREEAVGFYSEMTKSGSRLFRAAGWLHLGDLENPLAAEVGGGGDTKKAREMYEKGLEELPQDQMLLSSAELLMRRMLEHRLAALP